MNEQLKSRPRSGHESDRIKNGIITPGGFITAEPVFKYTSPVEAFPVHHTVKQLTMTLNALLASAESAFGARVLRTHTPH